MMQEGLEKAGGQLSVWLDGLFHGRNVIIPPARPHPDLKGHPSMHLSGPRSVCRRKHTALCIRPVVDRVALATKAEITCVKGSTWTLQVFSSCLRPTYSRQSAQIAGSDGGLMLAGKINQEPRTVLASPCKTLVNIGPTTSA